MSGSDPLEEQGCEPARLGWPDWGSREEWGGGTQWRALHGFKCGSEFEERLIAQPGGAKEGPRNSVVNRFSDVGRREPQ